MQAIKVKALECPLSRRVKSGAKNINRANKKVASCDRNQGRGKRKEPFGGHFFASAGETLAGR